MMHLQFLSEDGVVATSKNSKLPFSFNIWQWSEHKTFTTHFTLSTFCNCRPFTGRVIFQQHVTILESVMLLKHLRLGHCLFCTCHLNICSVSIKDKIWCQAIHFPTLKFFTHCPPL
jgi:hypothetical protein